jgi:hypothetical protein
MVGTLGGGGGGAFVIGANLKSTYDL